MPTINAAFQNDLQAEITYARLRIQDQLSGVVTPETGPVFRFYDSSNGTHFFTGDMNEALALANSNANLVYEHSTFRAYTQADAAADLSLIPVYRFFDTNQGTHFYTASSTEKAQIQTTRPDLTLEGASFYEHLSPAAGDAPVYRFFDTALGTHLYTSDLSERATILASRPDLTAEGIAFYAPKT